MVDLRATPIAQGLVWRMKEVHGVNSFPAFATVALVVISAASCKPADQGGGLRKLIGDGSLPEVTVGATETVIVSLAKPAPDGFSSLEYTIAPGGRLTVQLYKGQTEPYSTKTILQASETVQLSKVQADSIRKSLAAYRPMRLDMNAPGVLPKDCNPVADDANLAVVAFRAADGSAGTFQLQSRCDNPNAKRLAEGIRQSLSILPMTKPAAHYRW